MCSAAARDYGTIQIFLLLPAMSETFYKNKTTIKTNQQFEQKSGKILKMNRPQYLLIISVTVPTIKTNVVVVIMIRQNSVIFIENKNNFKGK